MLFDIIFAKFILVGIINTASGIIIMFGLYNLAGFGYWQASAANYVLMSILSFFLNKYFTFGVKTWSWRMVAAFTLTIIVSYGLAYGIAKPLVYAFMEGCSRKIRDNSALFTGMCLFTGFNYLGQRFIAFAKKTPKETDAFKDLIKSRREK